MSAESTKEQVRESIKKWERDFKKKHDRLPSKEDIKRDSHIHQLYKTYRASKSRPAKNESVKNESVKNESVKNESVKNESVRNEDAKPVKVKSETAELVVKKNIIDINVSESEEVGEDDRIEMKSIANAKVELGPTPQANGKVLSIFDFGLTPPESSPLKGKTVGALQSKQSPADKKNFGVTSPFKTPTKIKKIITHPERSTERQSSGHEFISKLKMASVETPSGNRTHSIPRAEYMQTPQYLSNATKNFSIESPLIEGYSPKSQGVLQDEFGKSPSKEGPFSTPTKSTSVNFSISPSPLKPHRFLTKKLSDVFNDLKTLQETDMDMSDFDEEEAKEEDDKLDEDRAKNPKVKKSITQKRSTRRWKIKPKFENGDSGAVRNVHKEIAKIDKKTHQNMVDYMNSDHEEELEIDDDNESDSNTSVIPHTEGAGQEVVRGKRKPLSMNFQRAKINDPRIKRFKRYMNNR